MPGIIAGAGIIASHRKNTSLSGLVHDASDWLKTLLTAASGSTCWQEVVEYGPAQ